MGKTLCVALLMSSIATNMNEIQNYLKYELKRFYDRGFNSSMKKDLEDEDDDVPNTRLKDQEDLEVLYTGQHFEGEKTLSRMMSTFFVIMTYSSGMPVLYIVGVIFFTMTFYVNKVLIFKYYQKSNDLSR